MKMLDSAQIVMKIDFKKMWKSFIGRENSKSLLTIADEGKVGSKITEYSSRRAPIITIIKTSLIPPTP